MSPAAESSRAGAWTSSSDHRPTARPFINWANAEPRGSRGTDTRSRAKAPGNARRSGCGRASARPVEAREGCAVWCGSRKTLPLGDKPGKTGTEQESP